jgi:hypothetical protein
VNAGVRSARVVSGNQLEERTSFLRQNLSMAAKLKALKSSKTTRTAHILGFPDTA